MNESIFDKNAIALVQYNEKAKSDCMLCPIYREEIKNLKRQIRKLNKSKKEVKCQ